MTNKLYREEILEHYKTPQNFGILPVYDISARQVNIFCGDEVEMFIKLQRVFAGVNLRHPEGVIEDIAFIGKGCAICIVATSLLTEYVKGKTIEELTKFSKENMLSLLRIQVSETRKKCSLLGWAALRECLKMSS